MATITGNTSNGYQWYISWSESNINIANNTSTVTAKLILKKVSSNSTSYNNSGSSVSITINGSTTSDTVTFDLRNASVGTTKTLITASRTVTHNSDGSKSITISGKHVTGISMGTQSVSGTAKLSTIARASTFSASGSFTPGGTVNLSITKYSSSFTHNIYYSVDGASYVRVASGSTSTSPSFTLPTSLASQITNKSKTSINIKVITYNSGTKIGEKINSYTFTIPYSTYAPSLSISLANTTGGNYLTGKSAVRVTSTASAKSGASIKKYQYFLNGVSIASGTGSVQTTPILTKSGSNTIKVTVTDSRGYSTSVSKTITVYSYKAPSVSSFSVRRTDSSGVTSNTGTRATVNISLTLYNYQGDSTVNYTVYTQYRVEGSSTWSSLNVKQNSFTGQSTTTSVTNKVLSIDIGTVSSYEFRVKVVDETSTSYSGVKTITPTFVLMDFNSNGKGVCFGSTSTRNGVEVVGQKMYVESFQASGTSTFNGNVSVNANLYLYPASDNMSRIRLLNCGKESRAMQFTGGDPASNTVINLYDSTNQTSVWRYTVDNVFRIYKEVCFQDDGRAVWFDSSAGKVKGFAYTVDGKFYVGNNSVDGNTNATTYLRGKNVRIYNHAGGGVYLGSSGSTAVTSDENFKHDIAPLDDRYENFFNEIEPVGYVYNNGHRTHMGFIAQRIEEALGKAEISTEEFAGLVREENVDVDMTGNETTEHYDKLYSLRYEEFIPINTFMIKKILKRLDNIENRLDEIENRLNEDSLI